METRRIHSLEVSVVGLGCNNFGWRIDAAATARVLEAALDAGINFLDTADIYSAGQSEEFLGRALEGRRNQVIIATKFGMKMDDRRKGAKPAYLKQAVEDSLGRLRTDRIDLYQLHQPDPETPVADTLGAMQELVAAGKVREIGCSNFTAAQLREAGPGFASVQNQYSLLHREPEAEVIGECVESGRAFIPYFPLANGLLTGKYRRGRPMPENSRGSDGWGPKVFTDKNLATVEGLIEYAESRGRTILELAIGWLLSQPAVSTVIAGATKPDQIKANAAAAGWRLTEQEKAEVNRLL